MSKNLIKEIIILLLLILATILVLGVVLYEYVPMNKVIPEKVSEDDMTIMAHAIAKQIEEQVKYPGQIKVNVIRETRAQDTAK